MSDIVLADGTGVLIAREGTPGVQPTAAWLQLQINAGGITDFTRQNVEVEHNPLSPNLTPEAGEVVGYDVSPKLAGDLTRDMLNMIREPMFRSLTQHSGGKGKSLYYPTAVTSTGYTVGTLGDYPINTLFRATGWANAANNGLKVTLTGSTTSETKFSGLVAETAPAAPASAILELAGIQGATGDITMDVNGNLTSTVLDFTTLGLNVGQGVIVGDPTSGAAFAFANTVYTGLAYIKSITAHLITFMMRQWVVGALDAGTGKTIRILFTRFNVNVPLTDAVNYLKYPTVNVEVSEPGAGSAGATDYTYGGGLGLDTVELDIPVEGKVGCTMGFIGMNMTDPGAARATGAATALQPLLAGLFSTAAKMPVVRLLKKSDESVLSAEINGAKVTIKNNIQPRKQLGVGGAAGLIYGLREPMMNADTYVLSNDLTRAANANTDCTFDFLLKNSDGGFCMCFNRVQPRKPTKAYAAHTSVMLSIDVPATRDLSSGQLYSMSEFAYAP